MPHDFLTGYAGNLSVAPGETIRFMASSNCVDAVQADIVRIVCGDLNPNGPGYKETLVPSNLSGTYPVKEQPCFSGSYVVVDGGGVFSRLESFSLQATIWPTTPDKGRQALLGSWSDQDRSGFCLMIDDRGALCLMVGDGAGNFFGLSTGQRLRSRVWAFVAASFDAETGEAALYQEPLIQNADGNGPRQVFSKTNVRIGGHSDQPFLMAGWLEGDHDARPKISGLYNGKIERPRLANRALNQMEMRALSNNSIPADFDSCVVAAWDFAQEIGSEKIVDISANDLHGRAVNLPTRGMTGSTWLPEHVNCDQAPGEYSVIHFHDDDIYDAGWEPTVVFTVPADMRSGFYALRLRAGDREDRIPFIVRPLRGKANAKLALLAPTATWLAYANLNPIPFDLAELLSNRVIVLHEANILIDEHPEWGPSLYDVHSDGSGVCYSSSLRPILNMRPGYISSFGCAGSSLREFNADTLVVDWLEARQFDYDVITDEDLHNEGVDLLSRYDAIVTGTHPEYFSTAMWDAVKAYTDGGGRMAVLGGNGFYWRIGFHESLPGVIEVRRAGPAIRTWETAPGEEFQSFDGLRGGLWRALGRPPQTIQGTGFVAEGFDLAQPYHRNPASHDPRARFIFEGISETELVGNFGLQGGGAAGVEIDRADFALGTPEHALILGTSEGHSEAYRLVNEEVSIMIPNVLGPTNDRIAADMVFFETPGGGGVFSTGSIAWAGSLSHDGYANNVSRITENVLKRFLDPTPFEALSDKSETA